MIYNPKQKDKRLQPFHKGVPLPGFRIQEYKTKTPAHAQSQTANIINLESKPKAIRFQHLLTPTSKMTNIVFLLTNITKEV